MSINVTPDEIDEILQIAENCYSALSDILRKANKFYQRAKEIDAIANAPEIERDFRHIDCSAPDKLASGQFALLRATRSLKNSMGRSETVIYENTENGCIEVPNESKFDLFDFMDCEAKFCNILGDLRGLMGMGFDLSHHVKYNFFVYEEKYPKAKAELLDFFKESQSELWGYEKRLLDLRAKRLTEGPKKEEVVALQRELKRLEHISTALALGAEPDWSNGATVEELAAARGCTGANVRKIIKDMRERNLLDGKGGKTHGYWPPEHAQLIWARMNKTKKKKT